MLFAVLLLLVTPSVVFGVSKKCVVDKHGLCFTLSDDQLTWREARKQCQHLKHEMGTELHSDLAILEKASLQEAINSLAALDISAWIGLHELAVEAHPYWVDGEKLGHYNPDKIFPWNEDDNDSEENDCVLVVPNAEKTRLLWQYANCNDTNQYICTVSDIADEHASKQLEEEETEKEKTLKEAEESVSGIIEKESTGAVNTVEGDIILPPSILKENTEGHKRKRAAIWIESYKWPDAKVYYKLDRAKTFTQSQGDLISSAMAEIESNTCIQFIEQTDQISYVNIIKDGGCLSFIGRHPSAPSILSLTNGCFTLGVVIHELLHAVGFLHEQSRWDRDDFVRVNYDNIRSGRETNFFVYSLALTQDISYDYTSVLHYHAYAFAIDGSVPTLEPILPVPLSVLGQRGGMSPADIADVNKFYDCPHTSDGAWSFWTAWTECDITCGGGTQTRTRECNTPPPSPGGLPCEGEATETRTCMDILCPDIINYEWLGCWRDIGESELLNTLENSNNPYLTGNYWEREDPVRACVLAGNYVQHNIVALRFDGKCYSQSPGDGALLYQDGGPSDECYTGTGTTNALDVYSVEVTVTDIGWSEWSAWSTCQIPGNSECIGGLVWGERVRTRQCGAEGTCEGSDTETEHCSDSCQGTDQWTCDGHDIFIFVTELKVKREDAKTYCENLPTPFVSHLAILQNEGVFRSAVQSYALELPNTKRTSYWIGCDDIVTEGEFKWADGEDVTLGGEAGWSNKQPKTTSKKCADTGKDCCELKKKTRPDPFMMVSECCTKKKLFICHIPNYQTCVDRED